MVGQPEIVQEQLFLQGALVLLNKLVPPWLLCVELGWSVGIWPHWLEPEAYSQGLRSHGVLEPGA